MNAMVKEKVNEDTSASDRDSGDKLNKREINWADPNVPVGNAPPVPHWPVAVFVVAWAGWITFLVVMLMST